MRAMRRPALTRMLLVAALLAVVTATAAQTEPPDDEGDAGAFAAPPSRPWRVVPLVDASTPVASGRHLSVGADEVFAWLRDSAPVAQRRYAGDPSLLNEILDRLVADRLLAHEARRRGLERDPVVRAALERALVARLRALVLNPRAGDATAVTDEEAQRWYDAHPERFHVPERRRARVVFTPDRLTATELLRLAQFRRRGRLVNDFRRLATERNSDLELAGMRGEIRDVLPPMASGGEGVDLALRQAVYELREENAFVPRVVPGRWRGVAGFFVVRYLDRRAPIDRTFAESHEWIRHRIVLERRVAVERAEVERLERESDVRRIPLLEVVRLEPEPEPDAGSARR